MIEKNEYLYFQLEDLIKEFNQPLSELKNGDLIYDSPDIMTDEFIYLSKDQIGKPRSQKKFINEQKTLIRNFKGYFIGVL
jgi:hypothetical protein